MTRLLPASEADIQAAIEEGLGYLGYLVLHTQHRYREIACRACGHRARASKGYGADLGVPDLLCTHMDWPRGVWVGIEVKGPKTAISAEQRALQECGRIVVVRSFEEARDEVEAISRQLEAQKETSRQPFRR